MVNTILAKRGNHIVAKGAILFGQKGQSRVAFPTAKRKFHNGIDLRANYEPCYAILDGIVERIGNDKRSGKFITLRHGNYTISYCHLSHILVPQGRPVQAGTPIAITGSSGRSTAPHLHLSIKYKRKSIDAKVLLDYIVHSKDSKFWCQGVNQ